MIILIPFFSFYFADIYNYFVNAPACDDLPNQNFRSISEGMNYLNSGWVGRIMHRNDGGCVFLKAQVRFSQSIANYHQVEVTVDRGQNKITSVKCDCIASEGKCCSHSAGVAFKINEALKKGFIGIECTDQACLWNRSTQENVVPDTVENIRDSTSKSTMNSMLSFETDDCLREHLNRPSVRNLASIPGTILHHVLTAKPAKPKPIDPTPPPAHGLHDGTLDNCELCTETFDKHIRLSEASAEILASQTSNQNSALWTSQRKLRITSSSAASVPKKTDTDSSKWIGNHIHPRFTGNAATRHGQQNEALARETFEKASGKQVETTGLVVRPEESWLGASLDGIVDADTILEIKCPTDRKMERYGGTVQGLIASGTYDVRSKDGKAFLRQTTAASGYYTQVQCAMYCSRRTKCKFMVWSKVDYVIVDVNFDKDWFNERMDYLRKFYFMKLLPVLTDSINKKELKIVQPFMVEH